ncbi:MAG: methyltransferase domain-containing protein, partial [Pseudomonadota bacterium]
MNDQVRPIKECRISGSENLKTVLRLGDQAMTGVFPKDPDHTLTIGPLELVWCPDSGLVQLGHTYDLGEMYGMNYGYRSGLNSSMVRHLEDKVVHLQSICPLDAGDIVLDIGSNDATLLSAYTVPGLNRIGIDPTGKKFAAFYGEDIELVPDFFSVEAFRSSFATGKAKIITSISMFYDLEAPLEFVRDVVEILEDDGIWHFEQSYLPTMLQMNAYDTVCHEHLEYYSLRVVKTMLESCGLKLLEKKKTELALKSRKEIADYIQMGKPERAKIRVEHIIREDYLVEALE